MSLGKGVTKKTALPIMLAVTVVLVSSSAFAMLLANWNGYNDGTNLEKQYRTNIRKLKANPQDLQVRYELLIAMYRKGLHAEGKTQLQYILEHAPPDSEILFRTIFYKGLYLSLDGQYEEAIAAYRQYLNYDDRHGEAWLNLSYLYYSTGRYQAAALTLNKAEELIHSPDIPYLRGMLFLQAQNRKAAQVMFEKALQLDNHHQKALEMLKTIDERRVQVSGAIH